jgi:molecular chaperone HscB
LEQKLICWKCKEKVGAILCVGCGSIQPPPPTLNFFDVLGVKPLYFIEIQDIEVAYRKLSKKIHPDRFRSKKALERRMSLQWTALVNEARRVLIDPILRARYLATGKAQADETGSSVEQSFLETIFELQMQMMTDPSSGIKTAITMQEGNIQSMHEVFMNWEEGNGVLDSVEEYLGRWKYLNNIIERGGR